MKQVSADIGNYLRSTDVLDWETPLVSEAASRAASGIETDVAQAQAIFEFVRDTIPHSWDIKSQTVTCSASEVLREGTGICLAKSHLLAAMCRAVSIPAGLCYQRFRRELAYRYWGIHGFNAIYLHSQNRWVRVDARGNKAGVNAQFSLDQEQLAFPPDASRGEFIYEGIHPDPDPGVVDFLTQFTDLRSAWAELPETVSGT